MSARPAGSPEESGGTGLQLQPQPNQGHAIVTLLDVREAFPLAPEAGRIPHSAEPPTGPQSRPWVLRFARVPDVTQADVLPPAVYDEDLQVSVGPYDGDPLYMGKTHSPTVPDGNMKKPPPLDEGTKD